MAERQWAGWTTGQLQFVSENWRKRTDEQMADILGRSVKAVEVARRRLGITRRQARSIKPTRSPIPTPGTPRGIQPDQIAWAEANPGHPEAALIMGMSKELPRMGHA